MGSWQRSPAKRPKPGGFRVRLLMAFLIPVLLLSCVFVFLTEHLIGGATDVGGLPVTVIRLIVAGAILLALLLAIGLALHMGDRFTRPVAWLLRAIDAGQVRLLSQMPPPAADWELGILCERVRVLLRQNLSGATAMEELESLRSEISAVLDAAEKGELAFDRWLPGAVTHRLTRRLVAFFRTRGDRVRAADEGVTRLRGLLEQDWRAETLTVEEIAKRAERCYLLQAEIGVELERLERLLNGTAERRQTWDELRSLLEDLRLGIDRWRAEVAASLAAEGKPARMETWERWIEESHELLDDQIERVSSGRGATLQQISTGLSRVGTALSGSGEEAGFLSREAVQLKHTWGRLGERLRSLTVRVGELQDGVRGTKTASWEDTELDASE